MMGGIWKSGEGVDVGGLSDHQFSSTIFGFYSRTMYKTNWKLLFYFLTFDLSNMFVLKEDEKIQKTLISQNLINNDEYHKHVPCIASAKIFVFQPE